MRVFISLVIIFSLLLIGCNKKPYVANVDDVDELSQYFYQHQAQFNALAEAACSYKASLPIGFDRFRLDDPVTYSEHQAPFAAQMDTLLNEIRAPELILHQTREVECSLFIRKWAFWQSEGGSHMGYSYHPPKLSEYNPAIHQKGNRNIKERTHFTKALADGWYIEYVNIP